MCTCESPDELFRTTPHLQRGGFSTGATVSFTSIKGILAATAIYIALNYGEITMLISER